MGLTKTEDSPGLSFEINKPQPHYSPGDTISGRVVLNTADEVALGKVVVSFWGRAKSRIIQQHGQAVTYRERSPNAVSATWNLVACRSPSYGS